MCIQVNPCMLYTQSKHTLQAHTQTYKRFIQHLRHPISPTSSIYTHIHTHTHARTHTHTRTHTQTNGHDDHQRSKLQHSHPTSLRPCIHANTHTYMHTTIPEVQAAAQSSNIPQTLYTCKHTYIHAHNHTRGSSCSTVIQHPTVLVSWYIWPSRCK